MLSVIVCTHNHFHLTWHLLDSIFRTADRSDLELILVDNASTDDTRSLMRWFDRVIENSVVGNLASSMNLGIAAATHESVAILNNDLAILTADWPQWLARTFAETHADIVMPFMIEGLDFDPRVRRIVQAVEHANERGALWAAPVSTHLELACAAFRRTWLAKIGPFDEGLPTWYHHQDLFVRMRAAGDVSVVRAYNVVVRHLGNSTIQYGRDPAIDARLRAEFDRFLAKHPPDALKRLGLSVPAFGPEDLLPGARVFRSGELQDLPFAPLEAALA